MTSPTPIIMANSTASTWPTDVRSKSVPIVRWYARSGWCSMARASRAPARSCPRNVSEPGTLQDAIERLNASVDGQKPTVIMDAGIATEANVSWLAEQGYDWICVHRGRRPLPPEREPDSTLTTQAGHAVRVWQLQQTKQEALLYAVSEARKHKEEQILQRRRTLLEAALTSLHEGLQKPYHTKRYPEGRRAGRTHKRALCPRISSVRGDSVQ